VVVLLAVKQLITASATVPLLLTAVIQMRPGVLLEKPIVDDVGIVTDSAAVTLMTE
jgi:hypothetical protein